MESSSDWVIGRMAEVLEVERDTIAPEMALAEDLEADSVDLIEVANSAETEYSIVLDEADFYDIRTVSELIALIDRVRAET